MKIAVIDAQGAGIGQTVIKRFRKEFKNKIYIIALGTNITATQNMLKAGANEGFCGENEIIDFCIRQNVDAIIGPIGILISGGINGEITSAVSNSIIKMNCKKYIIPLQKHGLYIPYTANLQIKDMIEDIVTDIKQNI
ncbi:hypothetical protein ABG79_00018 [Caloramator mitchellensis]|uniref:DUF3842 family protein n=1 Tax=Caloramator mitchellensis TaxID=908809 RepID=A0A0R3JZZ4_CALMK|nr:DUF3842 family protein [Caloramator mitchellensis]KRQ87853.1 hypothetical protein ABG79_00018 [Caloramator mitchellensis]